ncbi:MAG TPA: efflux RND transporter periplasmic adaptor subunit [Acidobacteriaceae bacterium]|nr:efflux RND transporter periplasmic adaptor subunit [Acidobacteriaceae bacterium]
MKHATIFATFFLLTCLGCHDQAANPTTDAPEKTPVEVATIHPQSVTDRLVLPARVTPDPTRVVHIYSQITGRLVELYVRPGQEVTKGQTIGLIQSSEIAAARADYDKAKIEVARSDRQLDRAKQLLQHEVMAQRDYDDLEAADQAAHAELTRSIQRIKMLGFSPEGSSDSAALRAPISGAVLDIGSASGEMQRSLDNASPIATVANLDSVWILGDVFEQDLNTVRAAQSVDVTLPAYPGETWHGKISNISDAMDPTSRTLKVRVVLPNPKHLLKPEMFANISIARTTAPEFVLPTAAVVHEGTSSYVFLQTSPGKYERRQVSTGALNGKTVVVTSGLKDGDQIVTAGAALLRAPAGD